MKNKIIIWPVIAILLISLGCANQSPVGISEVDGHDFVSCNIDKIKETRDLRLSEIAEYSEIVVLAGDTTCLETDDYDIRRTFVSDKYIIVMPWDTPPLLYSRDGKFIRRLVAFGSSHNKPLGGLLAEIDDKNDRFYILAWGIKLLVFNLNEEKAKIIPKAEKGAFDFVLIDEETIFTTFPNHQNIWCYIQPLQATQAEYLYGRFENNLLNYISSRSGNILKWDDKILMSCTRANDTSYYFNPESKTFSPFLCCYSPKNKVNFENQEINSPELLDLAKEELLKDKKLLGKSLLFTNERYYIFYIFDDERQYFVIDKKNRQAYFLDKIINDFRGGLSMNYDDLFFHKEHYSKSKDGYLTFQYTIGNLRKNIKRLKVNTVNDIEITQLTLLENKIKNENDSSNVLLVNKLKR